MVVVCSPIRIGRWSELMVVRICHSDEVMREADANDTSEELGSEFPVCLVGTSAFRIESASWFPLLSVVLECQSEW